MSTRRAALTSHLDRRSRAYSSPCGRCEDLRDESLPYGLGALRADSEVGFSLDYTMYGVNGGTKYLCKIHYVEYCVSKNSQFTRTGNAVEHHFAY